MSPPRSVNTEFRERYGPWAIVAGASEGLGAAFARALAARGLAVVLIARRSAPMEQLSAEIARDFGVGTRSVAVDLAEDGAADEIVRATNDVEVGMLVCNAAYCVIAPFLDTPLHDHLRELRVNCFGPAALAHAFGKSMVERGRGGVIFMSSMAGLQGSPLLANYAATKAYNVVLAEGLWEEWRGSGVDVLACCAGAVRTPNFEATQPASPGRFVMLPEEVVKEAFDALGLRAVVIPGRMNRVANFLMRRILTRRQSVGVMSRNVRGMYGRVDED